MIDLITYNNKIDFAQLVGCESYVNDLNIKIYEWDSNFNEMSFMISDRNLKLISTEKISTALGIEIFIEKLKMYGFVIRLVEGFVFTDETKIKATGLIQAGFKLLIKNTNNFTVDNVFIQNFLTNSELDHLLSLNLETINLNDIR